MIFAFILLLTACGQDKIKVDNYTSSIKEFQFIKNKNLKDPIDSPLPKEEIKNFKGLEFFPIDSNYRVIATFVRTPDEVPFLMTTTTNEKLLEVKYGEAHFTLNGVKLKLSLYQNQDLKLKQESQNYLFLPFTDDTNAIETYGGGRYIDLEIPDGDEIIIDFNKAYNPYCVYNDIYSCPIPPRANRLNIKIKAGMKNYIK